MAGRENGIDEHAILVVAVICPISLVIFSMRDAGLPVVLELDGALMRRPNLKQITLPVAEKSEHVPLRVAHFRWRPLGHIRRLIRLGKLNRGAVRKPSGPAVSVPGGHGFVKAC